MSFNWREIEHEIIEQYYEEDDNTPWIIGFSGGKDSTMLLQLVWNAIKKQPLRNRPVYIVCNNTLVENPKILQYTDKILVLIEKAAMEQSMPFYIKKTTPQLEDTFWVNLIGKGYPAPNNAFRWCTERLKISPTSEFIKSTISKIGKAIILLGTRKDESSTRARSIEKNKGQVESSRLSKHPMPNAFTFAPIVDVVLEDVWQYLLNVPSPWGAKNRELITIYRNASGGDCPLVMELSTPSCGNSRFGCWVCTVVKRDKSMEALIDNGEEWMEPLVEFRDMLVDFRNDPEWRETRRRNDMEGAGPYRPDKRAYMLEVLLKAQQKVRETETEMVLINFQELVAIQVTWHRDSIFNFNVADIYNKVYGTDLKKSDFLKEDDIEKDTLKEVCSDEDSKLISELLELQKSKFILVNNYGLQNDIETYLERHIKNV